MIIQLPPSLINKIAAGEVVERPASVLKELIENSIDAEATKIEINIEKAGLQLVEVIDNGSGMNREDLEISCDSHTTSKITTLDDLENILTMGFRGEALASISSVSETTVASRTDSDKTGASVSIESGRKNHSNVIARERGTTVTVKRLFHKIPARKKFLKSETTEFRHILSTFISYALAYPNIRFSLSHNKKSVYNLPSVSKESFNEELKVRVLDLFGSDISTNLVGINYSSPQLQIGGFTGHPRIARAQRSHQLVFLNNRPVTDKLITKAVYDAYQTLIPKNHYPIFFLFLNLNPSLVDVNVHPRKSEVRFTNSGQIFNAVRQAVNHSLLKFIKKDTQSALKEYSSLTQNKHKAQGVFSKVRQKPFLVPSRQGTSSQAMTFSREILKTNSTEPFEIYAAPRSFQVFNTYIIIEKEDKLLIIDQHAAAERVTFDRLKEQISTKSVEKQVLLIPETIDLSKPEFLSVKEHRKTLNDLGIKILIFGKQTIKVEEIPALLSKSRIRELLKDLIAEISQEDEFSRSKNIEETENLLLSTLACHSSIRAGKALEREEIDDLVKRLLNSQSPYSCPHGRPIIWEIPKNELEGKFERH
ncbi:MAG: DNA mismatch repair endonuclease MutL [Candidatus Dojkabacteria bacterium]|nr:DNA mismatch repair endonuclease MutL [Candidatus Dojkabacteria bacterium]